MEIRAYDEEYLSYAQKNMGDMLDFAVNTCGYDLGNFYSMFLVSGVAGQIEVGNVTFLVGNNGCELARKVVEKCLRQNIPLEDSIYLDKSPEYWAGWAVCFYQWHTCRPFYKINKAISVQEIVDIYEIYHEMDIMHFVDFLNDRWNQFYTDTNLKRYRKNAGLSQGQLAQMSGVSIRQIQLFEQRKRNINLTRAIDLFKLSKVLNCKSEELLEI